MILHGIVISRQNGWFQLVRYMQSNGFADVTIAAYWRAVKRDPIILYDADLITPVREAFSRGRPEIKALSFAMRYSDEKINQFLQNFNPLPGKSIPFICFHFK